MEDEIQREKKCHRKKKRGINFRVCSISEHPREEGRIPWSNERHPGVVQEHLSDDHLATGCHQECHVQPATLPS